MLFDPAKSAAWRATGGVRFANDDRTGSGNPRSPDESEAINAWLKQERDRIIQTDSACCLAVAQPDDLDSMARDRAKKIIEVTRERLITNLRPYDVVFRYGPKALFIGLPDIVADRALLVLDRLRKTISAQPVPLKDGSEIAFTTSIGGTMVETELSIAEIVNRATDAVHAAAAGPGDRVLMWSPDNASA